MLKRKKEPSALALERRRSFKILCLMVCIFGPLYAAVQINGRAKLLLAQQAAEAKAQAERPLKALASTRSVEPVEEVDDEPTTLQARNELVERRKDMCIAAMIQGEAGNQPIEGQRLAGYVGHMRAVDRWFNSDNPCIQVCKKGKGSHREFDGTKKFCTQIEAAYRHGGKLPSVPEKFMQLAHEIRSGEYQPKDECRKVRYFANFAESSSGGIKYFQRSTKIRCVEGDHLFAEDRPKIHKALAKMRPAKRTHAKPVLEASASSVKPKLKKVAHR